MKSLRLALLLSSALLLPGLPAIAADAPAPAADTATPAASDKIKVAVAYDDCEYTADTESGDGKFRISLSNQIVHVEVPVGTPATEVVKMAGLEKLLTDSTQLSVIYQVPKNAPGGAPEHKGGAVNVGDLRAGKVQDVVMVEPDLITARNGTTILSVPSISLYHAQFRFPGGKPAEFVAMLQKHFGADWTMVKIPFELQDANVPEFVTEGNVFKVLQTYNSIADHMPAIGHWHWEGMASHPTAGTLTSDPHAAAVLKVKALPLEAFADSDGKKLDEAKIESLLKDIEVISAQATKVTAGSVADLTGNVSIQADSRILVVIGTQSYIDLVESVIAAHLENQRLNLEHQLHAAGLEPPPAK